MSTYWPCGKCATHTHSVCVCICPAARFPRAHLTKKSEKRNEAGRKKRNTEETFKLKSIIWLFIAPHNVFMFIQFMLFGCAIFAFVCVRPFYFIFLFLFFAASYSSSSFNAVRFNSVLFCSVFVGCYSVSYLCDVV